MHEQKDCDCRLVPVCRLLNSIWFLVLCQSCILGGYCPQYPLATPMWYGGIPVLWNALQQCKTKGRRQRTVRDAATHTSCRQSVCWRPRSTTNNRPTDRRAATSPVYTAQTPASQPSLSWVWNDDLGTNTALELYDDNVQSSSVILGSR